MATKSKLPKIIKKSLLADNKARIKRLHNIRINDDSLSTVRIRLSPAKAYARGMPEWFVYDLPICDLDQMLEKQFIYAIRGTQVVTFPRVDEMFTTTREEEGWVFVYSYSIRFRIMLWLHRVRVYLWVAMALAALDDDAHTGDSHLFRSLRSASWYKDPRRTRDVWKQGEPVMSGTYAVIMLPRPDMKALRNPIRLLRYSASSGRWYSPGIFHRRVDPALIAGWYMLDDLEYPEIKRKKTKTDAVLKKLLDIRSQLIDKGHPLKRNTTSEKKLRRK